LPKGAIVITLVHKIDKNTEGFKTGSFLYCAKKEITKHKVQWESKSNAESKTHGSITRIYVPRPASSGMQGDGDADERII